MSSFPDSSLPPPRWRGARTKGGCGRTVVMVIVGVVGLGGAFCCCWSGLVHRTVEDALEGREIRDRNEGVPEPLRITPSARDVLQPEVGEVPVVVEEVPTPGSRIEVRQGLKPMSETYREQPAKAEPKEQKDEAPSGPSERELFGF